VRVRLTRIDDVDLNLFEFDYDVTMMIFFLNAEGKVYARYGGRDTKDADGRQSLPGLAYTMRSVLAMHERDQKAFAPRSEEKVRTARDGSLRVNGRGCMHCHQVKEAITADLQRRGQWSRDLFFRYPLPENLGFDVEVDRGNVVKDVNAKSPAATAGLKPGDTLTRLNAVPTHSFGDVQFALDRAPLSGTIPVSWQRDGKVMDASLKLPEGWRKTDLAWRPSMRRAIAVARMYAKDLTPAEKKEIGLGEKQLAFRLINSVSAQSEAAGLKVDDIIIDMDDKHLALTVEAFRRHVESNYLVGDKAKLQVLRDGKPMTVQLTFKR
jgi:predicted metalloprotease with PDZ domain